MPAPSGGTVRGRGPGPPWPRRKGATTPGGADQAPLAFIQSAIKSRPVHSGLVTEGPLGPAPPPAASTVHSGLVTGPSRRVRLAARG